MQFVTSVVMEKMTDKYVKEIDSAVEVKSKEVMTV